MIVFVLLMAIGLVISLARGELPFVWDDGEDDGHACLHDFDVC